MTKIYPFIASLLISTVALSQENQFSCTINCPENISETVDSGVTSKMINYAIDFDCANLTTDCQIQYTIDSINAQDDVNHAINTNWAGLEWIVANDFDVPAGETLKFTAFIPTLLQYAMEGDVYFFEDNNGQPGNLITSFQNINMSNINLLGTTSLGGPVYEATYELPTEVILTEGKYWVGLHAEMLNPPSIYSSVYWATTGVGNIAENGVRAYKSSNGGTIWNTSGSMQNSDGAFKLKYECEEPMLVMTEGFNSGDAFPVGETTVTHQLVLGDEILDTCTFTITVQETLGTLEIEKEKSLLYPNPVIDYLNIESIDQITQIAVYSLEGKMIRTYEINSKSARIDFASYASGIYIIKEISENHQNRIYKVTKK